MGIAIRAEHLSKEYRLGVINHGMLYKDMQSWLARRLGKPDPHAQIGEERFADREDRFWALKDICFDVEQGDRVGIIGRNGAGKSTLLKILSRITAPTEGTVKIKGKVTSLLEVGTGFHGELTGRENIYLNGAILGMKKHEIDRKIDAIIDFSEIENHIDTPVKRYSSGMYVRLAFSVAAHLDSDILIADEVLAVGDAGFQRKAVKKMHDLSVQSGRTVLFVSHNMSVVKDLCRSGIVLDKGKVIDEADDIQLLISKYLHRTEGEGEESCEWSNDGTVTCPELTPNRLSITERNGDPVALPVLASKEYLLRFDFDVERLDPNLNFFFNFFADDGVVAFTASPFHTIENYQPKVGKNSIKCVIPANLLNDKKYRIQLRASLFRQRLLFEQWQSIPAINFTVDQKKCPSPFVSTYTGLVAPVIPWTIE